MKAANKFVVAALVLISCFGIFSMAASAAIDKIGTGDDPAISGNNVVWMDEYGNVHLYDLQTAEDSELGYTQAAPAVDGDRVVWLEPHLGKNRIAIYDIPSDSVDFITDDVDANSRPAISGNRLVWGFVRGDQEHVFVRDLNTGAEKDIGEGSGPDVSGNKVVFTSDREGDRRNVYIYDVNSEDTMKVPFEGDLWGARIDGDRVIFADLYTRMGYIGMYDLNTKRTTIVTSDGKYSGDPNNPDCGCDTGTHYDISGDRIVYAKTSNDCLGSPGVWVYDINTGESAQVYNDTNDVSVTPDISGNVIVWGLKHIEGSTVKQEICVNRDFIAPMKKPTVDFTADVVCGVAPLAVHFSSSTTGQPHSFDWIFEPTTSSDWNSHHAVTARHTFRKPGVYTVSLKVKNDMGEATVVKKDYITVISPCSKRADRKSQTGYHVGQTHRKVFPRCVV